MKITVKQDKALMKSRKLLVRELTDPKSKTFKLVIKEVGELDGKQNQAHFASEGKSTGEKWEESPNLRYRAYKKRKVGNKKILTFSGKLRDSLRRMSHGQRVASITKKGLTLGTGVKYAAKHHLGEQTKLPRELMLIYHKLSIQLPERPVIRKTDKQAEALIQTVAKVFVRRMDEITLFRVLNNAARKSWAKAGRGARGFTA